jgi:hypothetical protein
VSYGLRAPQGTENVLTVMTMDTTALTISKYEEQQQQQQQQQQQ